MVSERLLGGTEVAADAAYVSPDDAEKDREHALLMWQAERGCDAAASAPAEFSGYRTHPDMPLSAAEVKAKAERALARVALANAALVNEVLAA